MHIKCPYCKTEYNSEDIAHTLKNDHFKCPVCDKKFPSFATDGLLSTPKHNYMISLLILLGITAASAYILLSDFSDNADKTVKTVPPKTTGLPPHQPPAQPSEFSVKPSPQETAPAVQEKSATPQDAQKPDKMKIVERIAAMYHVSHSYTMEGGFVCLDMAIDVWNQLKTFGIDAKIMGGNIHENITAWNFRQLAQEGNHAWVVATIGPNEKVAIETTEGKVIRQGAPNSAPYFKGIVFDDPAQIKRFELLRKSVTGNCRDFINLVNKFKVDTAEKRLRPEEIIARNSQIEQRKQDCDRAFDMLKEFEPKAIFY